MSDQAFTVFIAEQLEVGKHAREAEEQDMLIAAYMLYLLSDPKHEST